MTRSYLKTLWHDQANSARDSKRNKKERMTKKEREDNPKPWLGLEFGESVKAVEDIEGWRRIVETSTVVP